MLRSIVFALCAAVGLAATASAQDAKIAKGAQVYADQKCGMCHSIGDKGNKKGALDGVAGKYSPGRAARLDRRCERHDGENQRTAQAVHEQLQPAEGRPRRAGRLHGEPEEEVNLKSES